MTWNALPKKDSSGKAIEYSVQEVDVPDHYTQTCTGDAKSGYVITNTLKENDTTNITGTKAWNDNNNQDGARPESITIRLLADGREVQNKTVTAADDWKWSFTNLPKYNNGVEIKYTITEDAVPDYTSAVSGYDVTNTHAPGKTSVQVTKSWNDQQNQDGIRPDKVVVSLFADGKDTGKAITLNAENKWTASFTDLDEKANGKAINYTVNEKEVPKDYNLSISGDAKTGFTLTNTHSPAVTTVSGSKTWGDKDNQDGVRPDNITIRLLANGTEVNSKTVSEKDNWTWKFDNLPKYKDGTEIAYTITEDNVKDYTSTVDGFNVTNTYTPGKTSVQVTKSWNDTDNKDGIRPKSVTIHLFADGKDTGKTLELNEANHWSSSFVDLDAKTSGKAIAYTVSEEAVSGYTSQITGSQETGYTITNTHTPKGLQPSTPTNRFEAPKTGDASHISLYTGLLLASLAALISLLVFGRKRRTEK